MSRSEDIDFIRKHVSQKSRLCQIAEECSELAVAAMKIYRLLSDDNTTSVTFDDAILNLTEEVADVRNTISAISPDYLDEDEVNAVADLKLSRWVERTREIVNSCEN